MKILIDNALLRLSVFVGAAVGLVGFLTITAHAAGVTRVHQTSSELANGTIVSLDKGASEVARANRENINNLYGVVVPSGDLSFSHAEVEGTAVVATEGVIDTLVSTNNGAIKAGDPITVDAVEGVGEKALNSGRIIGIAQANFSGQESNSRQFTVRTGTEEKSVQIGTIPVKVAVQMFSVGSGTSLSGTGQNRSKALQIADSIAGQTVRPLALIVAGLVLLLGVFISAFLVTSSGYASLISIGRNPLAEKRIVRSLVKMLLIAVGVFVASIVLSYAVLITL